MRVVMAATRESMIAASLRRLSPIKSAPAAPPTVRRPPSSAWMTRNDQNCPVARTPSPPTIEERRMPEESRTAADI